METEGVTADLFDDVSFHPSNLVDWAVLVHDRNICHLEVLLIKNGSHRRGEIRRPGVRRRLRHEEDVRHLSRQIGRGLVSRMAMGPYPPLCVCGLA